MAFEDKEGRLHILESGGRFGTLPSEVRTSRLCTGAGEGGDTTEERRGALPIEEAEGEKDEEDGGGRGGRGGGRVGGTVSVVHRNVLDIGS